MSRSRHSRKPRRPRADPERPAIHYRDPANNERSVCNAEERAMYCGDEVVCTATLAEVSCSVCKQAPIVVMFKDCGFTPDGLQLAVESASRLMPAVEAIERELDKDFTVRPAGVSLRSASNNPAAVHGFLDRMLRAIVFREVRR